MATASIIARPYAKAAFEYAQEQHVEKVWAQALELMATIFADKAVQSVLHHPRVSQAELVEVILEGKVGELELPVKNFLRLLAQNSRLAILPEISEAYHQLMAQSQKICHAELITTVEVDAAYIEKIKQALSKKFNQAVELETKIDENLLGGAIIKAGDVVIDGSVRGQLNRLAQELRK